MIYDIAHIREVREGSVPYFSGTVVVSWDDMQQAVIGVLWDYDGNVVNIEKHELLRGKKMKLKRELKEDVETLKKLANYHRRSVRGKKMITNIEIVDCPRTGNLLISGFWEDETYPRLWRITGESIGDHPDLSEEETERAMLAQASLTLRYFLEYGV